MIPTTDIVAKGTPKNWRNVPFWSLFRREKKTGFPNEELLSVYRDYGVIPKSSRNDNHNKESEDLSGYQLVTKGALVTNKMKAWQGSIAISRYQGIVSPAYYVYTPQSDEHDQFLHYLLRSEPYIGLYARISKGVRVNQWDLEHEALRNIPVLLPDLATQCQIADFLDRETARIDLLIEKKQRLVALLGEKYSIFVSSIFSQGLDKDEKTTASNSRWFDTLPKDWSLQKLFWLSDRIGDGLHSTPIYEDEGGYYFVNGNNLTNGKVTIKSGTRRVGQEEFDKHFIKLDKSTLLLSINGTIGNTALYNGEPVILGKSAAYIRCAKNLSREYVQTVMQSKQVQNYFANEVTGTTIFNLSLASIRNMPVPMPQCFETQGEVVEKVNAEKLRVDTAVEKTNESIDRLKEYRSALITAAVTGQIDVQTYTQSGTSDRRLDAIQEEMGA